MTRLTRRIIALTLMLTVGITPAWAAAPVQANPNNTLFPGVDSTTLNAAAPYVDHATGAMTVLLSGSAASGTPSSVNVAQFGGASTVTGTGVSGSGVPRVTVSSDSTVFIQNSTGTYTDRSGSIATGGTSQTAMAANATRKKLLVQNPPTATENLYMNFTAAASSAASSVAMVPGAAYEESGNSITTEAVTINAATTGHVYTAKEM